MFAMYVSEILDYVSNLHFTLWQCCAPHLVRFTNKKHSHRVKWSSRFGLSGSVTNWPNISLKKGFLTLKGLKIVLTSSFKHQVFCYKLPWHLHKDFRLFFFATDTAANRPHVSSKISGFVAAYMAGNCPDISLQMPGCWLQMVLMSH